MTAQTKSGSNEFHGSGYFYDLDPVDPAKNPFSGKAAPNNWKQFGGAVGGPIIKNKLFFFGNYEGTRRTSASVNADRGSHRLGSLYMPRAGVGDQYLLRLE